MRPLFHLAILISAFFIDFAEAKKKRRGFFVLILEDGELGTLGSKYLLYFHFTSHVFEND